MSDDIVIRLRETLETYDSAVLTMARSTVKEVANEIERLRAAIRHLYFNEGVCYGDNCEQCELVFGLCDDKAVRGE